MNSKLQEIYDKYHQSLFQFLFYMVKNREQAEDLVQEVYIRVLNSYSHFEGRSSEKTWIFSIARHAALDYLRKQNRWSQRIFSAFDLTKRPIHDTSPLPEEIAVQNELIQQMYRCLDKCTVDQRSVVILRYIQTLSISETAQILGWTEGKVKTTQHRAIQVLKANMRELSEKEESIDEKIQLPR
ncbi:RNA polymerase sigma factor SigX [Bacillus sp. M6-12]|uniref:RNA polymerase sigma factor SigX n=1 Tax=Bacillus sp. M6-12 TaxID=2054166 RepID=UPI000C785F47|nr:RNA polymerase sigma factor SigX [Bacillus sp. M6-12]PLS17155.1 RNA polymerase sigma factor SigX [Bacillus sp. M6-12]